MRFMYPACRSWLRHGLLSTRYEGHAYLSAKSAMVDGLSDMAMVLPVLPLPLDDLERVVRQPADSNEVGAAAPHLLTASGALIGVAALFEPSASDEAHFCNIRNWSQQVTQQRMPTR
jgi:hypothetical protein